MMIINDQNIYELPVSKLIRLTIQLQEKLEGEKRKNVSIQADHNKTNEYLQRTRNEMTTLREQLATMNATRIKNEARLDELENHLEQDRARNRQETQHNIDVIHNENKKAIESLYYAGCEQIKNDCHEINQTLSNNIQENDRQHRNHLKSMELEYVKSLDQQTRQLKRFGLKKLNIFILKALRAETQMTKNHEENQAGRDTSYNFHVAEIDNAYSEQLDEIRQQYCLQNRRQLKVITGLKEKVEQLDKENLHLRRMMSGLKIKHEKNMDTIKNNENIVSRSKFQINMYNSYKGMTEKCNEHLKSCQNRLKEKTYKIASLEVDNAKWKQAYKANEERLIDKINVLQSKISVNKLQTLENTGQP